MSHNTKIDFKAKKINVGESNPDKAERLTTIKCFC